MNDAPKDIPILTNDVQSTQINLLRDKERRNELAIVELSTVIPSFYIDDMRNRIPITFEEVFNYIPNLENDKDWWPGIEYTEVISQQGDMHKQWVQSLRLVGIKIVQQVKLLDSTIEGKNEELRHGCARTVAVCIPGAGMVDLSYIAEYHVYEELDAQGNLQYRFTLVGKLQGPPIAQKHQGAIKALVAGPSWLFLRRLKNVMATGKFKTVVPESEA